MKFEVQFAYHVEYRRYRRKKHQTALVLSATEIDIEEERHAGEPAFVVDQELRDYPWFQGWQRFRRVDGRAGRVWRIEGRCFSEYCSVEDFTDRIRNPRDNPFNAQASDGCAIPFNSLHPHIQTYESITAEDVIKSWIDDGGRAKAELIARRAGAMRVIDGMVCVAVGEPVVDVREAYDVVEMKIVEGIPDRSDGLFAHPEFWHSRMYRLDDLREAKAFARRLAAETGKRLSASLDGQGAATYGLPQEGQHLNWSLDRLDSAVDNMFADLGESARSAWRHLELALSQCPEHHVTEVVATAAEQFLQELASSPAEGAHDIPPHILRQVGEDIRAWRERPWNDGDWSRDALPVPASFEPWVVQLLSDFALHATAIERRIPVERLVELRETGHVLLRHSDVSDSVARELLIVLDPDLTIVEVLSDYGIKVPFGGRAGVQDFLDRNIERLQDIAALGELSPIEMPVVGPTVPKPPAGGGGTA